MSQEHELSIFVALIELCKVPANYSPSERNRAVIAGVSRTCRSNASLAIKLIILKQLQDEIEIASEKIKHQLNNQLVDLMY